MTAFADHGTHGAGEPLALILRPGNAGSDHINATISALARLPKTRRRQVLIRTDSGGGTHEFLTWLTRPGRWPKYSIGFTITDDIGEAILRLSTSAWTPACKPCRRHPDQHPAAPPTREGHPRARGAPPTRRDSRATTLTRKRNQLSAGCLSQPPEDHERSRLGQQAL
ncbi:transposase [Streptosporangium canum]|uniref:transposase n=1 Tax=Streptosporangium canum TaxID=324952 RepID=UPI0034284B9C